MFINYKQNMAEKKLQAWVAIAVSSCCNSDPRTPEESREAYEKAKKERINYNKKEEKIVKKIEELQMDLVEIRAKEQGAKAKEETFLYEAKQQSSNYTNKD